MTTKLNKQIVKYHMLKLSDFAVVKKDDTLIECLELISDKEIGIACVINKSKKLAGILTDGDIRRMILNINKPISAFFNDSVNLHMNKRPISITENYSTKRALDLMGKKKIWDLPVINKKNELVGLLHLHPIAKYLNEKFT